MAHYWQKWWLCFIEKYASKPKYQSGTKILSLVRPVSGLWFQLWCNNDRPKVSAVNKIRHYLKCKFTNV